MQDRSGLSADLRTQIFVLWGFAKFSRSRMLVFVALTFPVGPSIVLILLGLLAGLQLCFVTNPARKWLSRA